MPLLFRQNPIAIGPYALVTPSSPNLLPVNLKATTATQILLAVGTRVHEIRAELGLKVVPSADRAARDRLIDSVHTLLDRINSEKELHWTKQRNPDDRSRLSTTMYHNLSRYATNLRCEDFFFARTGPSNPVVRAAALAPAAPIPVDPRTCTSSFHRDPITTPYISCPACFCLYPLDETHSSISLPHCTHKPTRESLPGKATLWTSLNIGGCQTRTVPIRKYLHQGLKNWVGRFLSRPGMEKILDSYGSDPKKSRRPNF
ncbi:hypothetical protein BDN72DRAFT_904384 [Pluteus cervinus]|uniref:Uncharacterized protein n=1 Tax=Pluteus cervinus TaxID=181527 RepID=A0ACD3A735_9AGAR|nr:hypothetical protein BDN72DRAFT_904384 [Pluteus cervinus]